MVQGVTIRPCQTDECAHVLNLWKEAGSMTSVTDTVEVLRCLMQMPATTLLVAAHQDKIIGSVIAAWDGWRGNIYRLAVLPDYRRQGIARALAEAAEDCLKTKGAQRIGGLVDKEDPQAVSFWDSLAHEGYARDETFVRYAKSIE